MRYRSSKLNGRVNLIVQVHLELVRALSYKHVSFESGFDFLNELMSTMDDESVRRFLEEKNRGFCVLLKILRYYILLHLYLSQCALSGILEVRKGAI
jgi:hypothetical protein